ncbi:uncharacterized protein LOC114243543 [Bombyx mandarina]|uniref:Uncharacterized protein LOC114243543 n=1 Tax=Bombyx mandarina TaxID=7092 RepID=A0A6J2JMF6_BOMMA|nr:uncharacterized protein LOC114243543 [Bombyx mandarina]
MKQVTTVAFGIILLIVSIGVQDARSVSLHRRSLKDTEGLSKGLGAVDRQVEKNEDDGSQLRQKVYIIKLSEKKGKQDVGKGLGVVEKASESDKDSSLRTRFIKRGGKDVSKRDLAGTVLDSAPSYGAISHYKNRHDLFRGVPKPEDESVANPNRNIHGQNTVLDSAPSYSAGGRTIYLRDEFRGVPKPEDVNVV